MEIRDRLFIGGDWVAPSSGRTLDLVSPVSEQVWARVPEAVEADMDRAVAAARTTFDDPAWSGMPVLERAGILERAADLMDARKEEWAQLITAEMGSPITNSRRAHVGTPPLLLRYYAKVARDYEFEQERSDGHRTHLVRREPIGVVAAVCPWNWPLLTPVVKLAPAFAAGCTAVLKPSPETALDAYLFAEVFRDAGLPDGVLNIAAAGPAGSEYLVRHPGVDKVTFTGSTDVGRRIGAWCGERLKRVTLELGGKSAAIVLDDAPVEKTVAKLLPLAVQNSGQSCTSQTRILVSRERYDEFTEAFVAAVQGLVVGDPDDAATVVGPMVSAKQRDRIEGYIALGQQEGAKLGTGGGRPAGLDRGYYVEPTVFLDVERGMRIAQEEIFGPVVSMLRYDDVDDAVAIANDSRYGLAGTVWTEDVDRGLDIARRVRTGSYRINGTMHMFETPAGGFKESGVGREFGPEGLHAFVEDKAIAVPSKR